MMGSMQRKGRREASGTEVASGARRGPETANEMLAVDACASARIPHRGRPIDTGWARCAVGVGYSLFSWAAFRPK